VMKTPRIAGRFLFPAVPDGDHWISGMNRF
jgi:hypothetical protein